jgi:hypothetical protein
MGLTHMPQIACAAANRICRCPLVVEDESSVFEHCRCRRQETTGSWPPRCVGDDCEDCRYEVGLVLWPSARSWTTMAIRSARRSGLRRVALIQVK